ncbi:MAG TPA: CDP-alcohol phosphatidyltransferase family protein [Terriglobales bacterium]|nr:CDP-alcohol phosphatidyltransferase family protein [Terriglobales bacterium]
MEAEKKAERVIQTLTGPWEKRVLPRMAQALPSWVTPDHLTVLGIAAGFIIFAGLVLVHHSPWWIMLSNAGFAIHWWADSLDGTVARVRHREREQFGYFVDHISDAFTTVLFALGLALSPLVHIGVGLSVALGYLLMNVYAHVEAYVRRVFQLSYWGVGPTEVRIICVAVVTTGAFWNPFIVRAFHVNFRLTDILVLSVGIGLVTVFIVSSIRTAIELDRLDRAKWSEK